MTPVKAQFEAYNNHDIIAFTSCFSEDFHGYRMPDKYPRLAVRIHSVIFYVNNRFNNPNLKAELLSRIVMGNKVFDHELIYGLSEQPLESVAVFEINNNLISTAWFYFP